MKADAVEAVRASTAAIFMVGCCCVLELTSSLTGCFGGPLVVNWSLHDGLVGIHCKNS